MKSAKATSVPSVVLKKVISARRSDVFDAWTKPEIMQAWFLPAKNWASKCAIDLRVGGHWENDMIDVEGAGKHGRKNKPGESFLHQGEYVEIRRPERLVFTWKTPFVSNTSRVTVELRDLGAKTELTLTHELLETPELRDAHNTGWTTCLDNLAALFA